LTFNRSQNTETEHLSSTAFIPLKIGSTALCSLRPTIQSVHSKPTSRFYPICCDVYEIEIANKNMEDQFFLPSFDEGSFMQPAIRECLLSLLSIRYRLRQGTF